LERSASSVVVRGLAMPDYFGNNPLKADLNPICHLLVLLVAHPILYISRIRVNESDYICTFY
jgi:hypothetical protein